MSGKNLKILLVQPLPISSLSVFSSYSCVLASFIKVGSHWDLVNQTVTINFKHVVPFSTPALLDVNIYFLLKGWQS